jgi:ABC-type multidrug transport system ATPase subunit
MAVNESGRSAFHVGSPILQVRDLRTNLLKPASLSLSAGECTAVTGPSGAGKTSLLRAIADLDPSDGLVCLDGRDRSTIAGPEWRRLVGYVPAEPGWRADTVGEHFSEWMAALAFVAGAAASAGAADPKRAADFRPSIGLLPCRPLDPSPFGRPLG